LPLSAGSYSCDPSGLASLMKLVSSQVSGERASREKRESDPESEKKKEKGSFGVDLGVGYKHTSSILSHIQSFIAAREKETIRSSVVMGYFYFPVYSEAQLH